MSPGTLSRFISRVGKNFRRPKPPLVPRRPSICPELLHQPTRPGAKTSPLLDSRMCTAADLESPVFRDWARRLGEKWKYHRKLWEYCYICQALSERKMLRPGSRGLGFAVGEEPLPAAFAALGCSIVATDLQQEDPRAEAWRNTQQWARGLDALNQRGLCPPTAFRERVTFQPADMNAIPATLTDFDFTWSSCSFEHCGSIELGTQFLLNQMRCLRPGGIAVHTTELNLTSNDTTLEEGVTVIFRRRDIERMVDQLRAAGHHVEPLNLTLGEHELDLYADEAPYSEERHLRLVLGSWVTTSIGLIIRHG